MKAPALEYLFNKVGGMRSATLLQRDSNTSVFPICKNFFYRTPAPPMAASVFGYYSSANYILALNKK